MLDLVLFAQFYFIKIIKPMLENYQGLILSQTQNKQKHNLVVATLNYCDIMNNPFQFYCAQFQLELEALSQIFVSLIPIYFPAFTRDKFSWGMGKVDQKIRTGRYSPAFKAGVGIINNTFIARQQFNQKWDAQFNKIPLVKQLNFAQQQRVITKTYDFLIYHTLLVYVYGNLPFQQLIKNDPELYLQKFKPFYQLSFLSEQRKLDKMMSSFSKISADLFFFQQYSQQFRNKIQKTGKYHTASDQNEDTLIIAKKQTFKVKYPSKCVISKQQMQKLNWAGRSAVGVFDRYIVINAHLSSDKAKNAVQINQIKTALLQLQTNHPNHFIILGGDLNSYLASDQIFEKSFNMYPRSQNQVTTVKKRTMIQGQFHKGNNLVTESKDKIISNLAIEKGSLRYINNEQPDDKSLLPSDPHPFDHYVVVVQLKRP